MDIQEFKPERAELILLSEKYKSLIIKDLNSYEIAKHAKKDLADKRIFIEKLGKKMRDDAIKFQRDVISKERDLISLIEPVEDDLKKKLSDFDHQLMIEKNREKIHERMNSIQSYLIDGELIEESKILEMNDKNFELFLFEKKQSFLRFQEEKMIQERNKIEQERLNQERLKREHEERIANEKRFIEESKIREQKRVEQELELQRIRLKQEEENRIKQLAIDEERRIKEEVNKQLFEREEQVRKQKEIDDINKKLEEYKKKNQYQEKFNKFLMDHSLNKDEILIKEENDQIKIYKFIGLL